MTTQSFTFGIKVRTVNINRDRSRMESIDATGMPKSAFNEDPIINMPSGDERQLEIHLVPFSRMGNVKSFPDLLDAIDKVGYKLADPVAFCALYEQDPRVGLGVTMWFDRSEGKLAYIYIGDGGFSGRDYLSANYTEYILGTDKLLVCVPK